MPDALIITDLIREIHAAQTEHPVVEALTLEELAALGEEEAYAAVRARQVAMVEMEQKPLSNCWVPPDWWLFLHELCKKRLEQPGAVLEVFVSGGIRAGKSFIVAWLTVCHWLYTLKCFLFCLAETEETSKDLQQAPIEFFLPPEVLGERGSVRQKKYEKMKFSGGAFTGGAFERHLDVVDETGRTVKGGGKVRFRYFTQSVKRYRGFSLTFAWSDEAVPVDHVDAVAERLASRAADTRQTWHIAKMQQLEPQLRALAEGKPGAVRPHPSLLGALMHGVHMISYTPEEGYTPTVRRFAQGCVKPDRFMVTAPELVGKPGVKDPRVPKLAYPPEPSRLLCYLHTAANRVVNAYPELSRKHRDSDERTIRIKLYGDAEASEETLFHAFTDQHIVRMEDVPRNGALYEVTDGAPAKPYSIAWFLVDSVGRHWQVQEWPCPKIPIEGRLPGMWAVPSKGSKLNGDPGTAQKLRLPWGRKHWLHLIWSMRQRLLKRFAETGEPFKGRTIKRNLIWNEEPDMTLMGEFALPEKSLFDSRFGSAPTSDHGEIKPLLEWYYDEENAIDFDPSSGVRLDEGDQLIQQALSTRVLGLPGLMVVDECENAIFTFRTYSNAPDLDRPPTKDEACKESRDKWAYYLLSGPEFIDIHRKREAWEAGGSF